MKLSGYSLVTLAAATTALSSPMALWAKPGDPIPVGNGITFDPQIDLRLRYEHVDLGGPARPQEADAGIARLRAGLEVGFGGGFSALAEAEGTLAIARRFNSTVNGRTGFGVVADPEGIELNRLQLKYARPGTTVTLGRQRINIDDQRFVGSVGWRANEQTFDAVRVESNALGPVAVDLTYASSQRTIFGSEAGPRTALDGNFAFANAVATFAPFTIRLFDYYVDYDRTEPGGTRFSSNTAGAKLSAKFTPAPGTTIDLVGSYARQVDIGVTTRDYAADYIWASAALARKGFTLTAAYEELGSDNGREAFQTQLATLHKFNGWADVFLVTPAAGLRDYQLSLAKSFAPGSTPINGLTASVIWHRFEADFGGAHYGDEWDAQVTFRPLSRIGATIKYANYDASSFSRDTQKLWLQLDYQF